MAVIYTDNTNKYDTSTGAIGEASRSKGIMSLFLTALAPVENAINDGLDIIGGWVSQFQLNKNVRRRDEQGFLLESDKAGYDSEGNTLFIVMVIVVLFIVIYAARK